MQMNENEWENIDINKYLKAYKSLKIICLPSPSPSVKIQIIGGRVYLR